MAARNLVLIDTCIWVQFFNRPQLMAKGHRLPLRDLALAAVALERDLAAYSTDPHFDLIPDLKRHSP